MEVNFFGAVALTKAFLPLLRASKGRVINISSVAGVVGAGSISSYSGSKFALEGFSDSLRKELRPLGVAVVLVNPGYVNTKIGNKAAADTKSHGSDPQWLSLYARYIENVDEQTARHFGLADTTSVTTDAIDDAAFSPRPKARYFVANVDGLPALLSCLVARVLPTYLFDIITELF